jgi:glycosyltransferase involved in cell wall biosynthesis/GT2 family glycosyltransferase
VSLRSLLGWLGPLDYDSPGTAAGPEKPSDSVDVVVPVYGAPEHFLRCLASLRRHGGGCRLVVVLDGPGQSEAEAALHGLGADVLVLRHPERRGYVAAVETGLAASRRDAILLNSDTIVTEGWAGKLQAAAYSSPAIATVTPFSNDASLCSLPRGFESNALPSGHDADSFGRLVEEVSERRYPRLPTGVGMCLYVKRAALEAVGGFDAARFGLGYGEEVELCLRALKGGWRHVLDDATFIYHAGQASFGASRLPRVRRAERILQRLHPEYRATIARFMREDPLAPLRARVLARLRGASGARVSPGRARVLHVVHGWPPFNNAGTEVYARGLARRQAREREVAAYSRLADPGRAFGQGIELEDEGFRVRLVVNNFTQRNPLARNGLRAPVLERDFAGFVDAFRPELVHVHHLAGHSVGLVDVLRQRRIPYLYQLQDWWTVCPRSNLLTPERTLCAGPSAGKCAACLPFTGVAPSGLWNPALHAARRALLARAVRGAAAVIVGSRFVEQSLRALGGLESVRRCHVLPYGIEPPGEARAKPPAGRLRFGVVGSIMPHKGIHVAVRAFAGIPPEAATLDIWGDSSAMPSYTAELLRDASPAVRLRGVFPEGAKDGVFAEMDVLLAPSLGLESFGLAVREAMARGVPVIAARRGALADAFEDDVHGAFFEPGDVEGLRSWILRLCSHPEILAEWSRRLPHVKTMDEHVAEIDAVYAEILS